MIISPDARGQIDGHLQKNILNYLPKSSDRRIVPISYFPDYELVQPPINGYVLIDFMEPHAPNPDYDKFWQWVQNNPPILTFKRELDQSYQHCNPNLKPIEWPCYLPIPSLQTKEQYDARPIEVLFFWGYSNVSRPQLHGEIFSEGMAKHGINVIDNWNDLDRIKGRTWVSILTPHWRRKPMIEILPIMQQSKITVSLPGNGTKTFRDTECVGTLMARYTEGMAFAYPWDDTNSIQLNPQTAFSDLEKATHRSDLYDLYVKCDENMRRYDRERYAKEYVLKEIQAVCGP